MIKKKVAVLQKRIRKLFSPIPFVLYFAWCGTFSLTRDGFPYIGNRPGNNRMLYALGYGGNRSPLV
ncbi:MAG: hypothetical protein LUG96_05845 [Tannerellaceae bacterium]|nr:hypothetical protein [Tannerellaceae bacterium]